ncbi:MAG TPA: PQQ-dependent dehydrogenase, methanol/ethanol family [Chryseolinea sp.]|nr:PQQ-dependent dehydrogenase, methanol/ethanol family [Chryseolinea sp.]
MKYSRLIILSTLIFSTCLKDERIAWIDANRLQNRDPSDWLSVGGNFMQQHYSPLDKVNRTNVAELGFAWEYDASSTIGNVPRGLEATPIVVDGIMYTSGAWGFVYALNARTGKEIWRYDPKVDASYARRACCDVVNRGVAVWLGKVYVGTLDGYLVCLDAKDGSVTWRKDTFIDRSKPYTITGPPQVARGIVMIGNSGGEYGVRGYITAYDLSSGEQQWRFFIVPGDPKNAHENEAMEKASKTWDVSSHWEAGGGGTAWGEAAYDPNLNLLYIGTGNSTPYPIWIRSPSGGDNLYLVSILAINPDNGKLVWHYQTTPGEIWDYTATMNIVLANIEIKGKTRKVLMQAPKNGFFYVLDRETGELLSAEKYTRVNWASHIDLKTGRPVLTKQGQWYKDEPKLVVPALAGGHNWQPMSFNPGTGLVYIPEHVIPMVYSPTKSYAWEPDRDNTGLEYSELGNFKKVIGQVTESADTTFEESLMAWDPVTQKTVWKVTAGAPDGGTLSTAGLVFQGTRTGYLKVYDALTGEKLKEIFTGTGIIAAPTTYEIDGEQYVAVMAGYGGAPVAFYPSDAAMYSYQNTGRILAFKLKGVETPLPPKQVVQATPAPPSLEPKAELVAKGQVLFYNYCETCHGGFGERHYSLHPDLSKLSAGTHELFEKILLEGYLSAAGMANFSNSLDKDEVEALHHYLIKQQQMQYKPQGR